jgi:hypothetical protein
MSKEPKLIMLRTLGGGYCNIPEEKLQEFLDRGYKQIDPEPKKKEQTLTSTETAKLTKKTLA